MSIPAGSVVALVGENGSGKSTLAKLLAGLYAPGSGRITWDGVDASTADRDQLFARVALVAQDFERWPFTAGTNIAIGRPEAPVGDGKRLDEAAAYAGADGVVDTLPRGLGTLLARQFHGGVELSGGQWQRFGIARARYRDAPLLICDEPTSALDPRAELETFDRIRGLAGDGQTVVLITHRLSSVRDADIIYVLHEGRLVEHGSHADLLDRAEGRYRELFQMQAARYAAPSAALASLGGDPCDRPRTPTPGTRTRSLRPPPRRRAAELLPHRPARAGAPRHHRRAAARRRDQREAAARSAITSARGSAATRRTALEPGLGPRRPTVCAVRRGHRSERSLGGMDSAAP